jgi:hypothetical protein
VHCYVCIHLKSKVHIHSRRSEEQFCFYIRLCSLTIKELNEIRTLLETV